MVFKHMKSCTMSLDIRAMQIKIIIRYHFIPIRISTIFKKTNKPLNQMENNKIWQKDVEKWELSALLIGM